MAFFLLMFICRYPHGQSVFSGFSDALGVYGHLSSIGHSQNGVIVIFSQFYSRFWPPFPPPFGKLLVNPLISEYENQLLSEQGGSWLFELKINFDFLWMKNKLFPLQTLFMVRKKCPSLLWHPLKIFECLFRYVQMSSEVLRAE